MKPAARGRSAAITAATMIAFGTAPAWAQGEPGEGYGEQRPDAVVTGPHEAEPRGLELATPAGQGSADRQTAHDALVLHSGNMRDLHGQLQNAAYEGCENCGTDDRISARIQRVGDMIRDSAAWRLRQDEQTSALQDAEDDTTAASASAPEDAGAVKGVSTKSRLERLKQTIESYLGALDYAKNRHEGEASSDGAGRQQAEPAKQAELEKELRHLIEDLKSPQDGG